MNAKTQLKVVQGGRRLSAVQRRTANSAIADPILSEEAEFLENLRGELWGRGGGITSSWTEIARDTKLASSTISNFATGNVRKPSIFTVRRIAAYFGYAMTFVKIKRR